MLFNEFRLPKIDKVVFNPLLKNELDFDINHNLLNKFYQTYKDELKHIQIEESFNCKEALCYLISIVSKNHHLHEINYEIYETEYFEMDNYCLEIKEADELKDKKLRTFMLKAIKIISSFVDEYDEKHLEFMLISNGYDEDVIGSFDSYEEDVAQSIKDSSMLDLEFNSLDDFMTEMKEGFYQKAKFLHYRNSDEELELFKDEEIAEFETYLNSLENSDEVLYVKDFFPRFKKARELGFYDLRELDIHGNYDEFNESLSIFHYIYICYDSESLYSQIILDIKHKYCSDFNAYEPPPIVNIALDEIPNKEKTVNRVEAMLNLFK